MGDLRNLLASAGFALTDEEELKMKEELEVKHRGKTILERPKEEVKLVALYKEDFEPKKTQKDPTEDLIFLQKSYENPVDMPMLGEGYIVVCKNTEEVWFAPTKLCLDANFIYREDLDIYKVNNGEAAEDIYYSTVKDWKPGKVPRKSCYILDNVSNETYEVYYDSSYPLLKYGKSCPNGMFVHRYDNRFHRDMGILELDSIYASQSANKASKMTQKKMKSNEAIIISDGCWMREVCSNALYYLDADSLINMCQGILPSEQDQGVLIAEINGARMALELCYIKKKKKIKYYYDNTSIVNVFKNRKTEYIREIVEYKELLEKMDKEGYQVEFIELHPKTGEERETDNRALQFFHNACDRACRDMSDIFKKDYKSYASIDEKQGKSYQTVKEESKPKGKPGQTKGNKPGSNFNPRKH